MAVTAKWYGKAHTHSIKGEIAYLTDTIKVILVGAGYVLDQDLHESYADAVATEVAAGNGYTAGGATLGTKTVTYDSATNRTRLFAANAVWTPAAAQTLSASGALIYKYSGTNSTSWLLGYVNFGQVISATGAALTINWDITDGMMYIQAA